MAEKTLERERKGQPVLPSVKDGLSLIVLKYIIECTFGATVRRLPEGHDLADIFHGVADGKVDQKTIEFVLMQYQQADPSVLERHLKESLGLLKDQIETFMDALNRQEN